jgi:acetyl-CoA carboxylase biotin carboxyl carrier protein
VVELLQRLGADEVQELEVRRGALRVRVSKTAPLAHAAQPPDGGSAAPAASVSAPDAPARSDYATINAPLTGIFYRSPSPQAEAFIQVGSQVASGDVIGLI